MTVLNTDRVAELLMHCYELLLRQKNSDIVIDLLSEVLHYDGVDCDGECLLNDIADILELEEV